MCSPIISFFSIQLNFFAQLNFITWQKCWGTNAKHPWNLIIITDQWDFLFFEMWFLLAYFLLCLNASQVWPYIQAYVFFSLSYWQRLMALKLHRVEFQRLRAFHDKCFQHIFFFNFSVESIIWDVLRRQNGNLWQKTEIIKR